jgi:hypothetical protein
MQAWRALLAAACPVWWEQDGPSDGDGRWRCGVMSNGFSNRSSQLSALCGKHEPIVAAMMELAVLSNCPLKSSSNHLRRGTSSSNASKCLLRAEARNYARGMEICQKRTNLACVISALIVRVLHDKITPVFGILRSRDSLQFGCRIAMPWAVQHRWPAATPINLWIQVSGFDGR